MQTRRIICFLSPPDAGHARWEFRRDPLDHRRAGAGQRQRFRETVKAEIAQTVSGAADVDDELRHLLAVLI